MNIFVCYSHQDTVLKNKLLQGLRHMEKLGIVFWHDTRLEIGSRWIEIIEQQITHADAAFFLISNDFLSSEFCQKIEVPKLISKGIKIFPIVLSRYNESFYNKFDKYTLGPKDDRGMVKPFEELDTIQRKKFVVCLGDVIYNTVLKQNKRSDEFVEDHELAEQIALEYLQHPSSLTLKRLISEYMLRFKRSSDWAKSFLSVFDAVKSREGIQTGSIIHDDILELLRAGLPEKPVHLTGISSITTDSLFFPGYSALLLGIRFTEKDYQAALTHLNKASLKWNFHDCVLFEYTLGQCQRKLGYHQEAETSLGAALKGINCWQTAYCSCGPECLRDGLLVEIHRGLGVVYRKLKNFDRAEEHFKAGEANLTKNISDSIKSDFLYGYGYYIFERAHRSFHLLGEMKKDDYLNRLRLVEEKFRKSMELNDQWYAPAARLQIIKQLLGNTDVPGYLHAFKLTKLDRGVESVLTGVLCQFAVLLNDIELVNKDAYRGFNSKRVYEELEGVFCTMLIPKGALSCHAFDITAITNSQPPQDKWLKRVERLLQDSEKWNYTSVEEQKKQVEIFNLNWE